MTTSLLRATIVATLFLAGCGGGEQAPPPETKAETTADAKGPAKKKGGATANTSRADELIKDLQDREARQREIQKAHDEATRPGGIPVVVEVTPSGSTGKKGGSGGGVYSSSSQPSASSYSNAPAASERDAGFWKQEVAMAEARLAESQRKLDAARQRMNSANAQMNDQNAAVRKMGQDAYNREAQEVRALESAVSQDRYALDSAKNAALRAGVPIR